MGGGARSRRARKARKRTIKYIEGGSPLPGEPLPGSSRNKRYKHIKNAILRDDNVCHYCPTILDKGTATLDHVIPLSNGGTNDRANCVLACGTCNSDKQSMDHDLYCFDKSCWVRQQRDNVCIGSDENGQPYEYSYERDDPRRIVSRKRP